MWVCVWCEMRISWRNNHDEIDWTHYTLHAWSAAFLLAFDNNSIRQRACMVLNFCIAFVVILICLSWPFFLNRFSFQKHMKIAFFSLSAARNSQALFIYTCGQTHNAIMDRIIPITKYNAKILCLCVRCTHNGIRKPKKRIMILRFAITKP